MKNYYAMYTWVMDKQAEAQRQAAERRLVRQSRHVSLRLRWPLSRRRAER